jgi:hypothetical protein
MSLFVLYLSFFFSISLSVLYLSLSEILDARGAAHFWLDKDFYYFIIYQFIIFEKEISYKFNLILSAFQLLLFFLNIDISYLVYLKNSKTPSTIDF